MKHHENDPKYQGLNVSKGIERVLHGVLDEEKTKDYESIQNLLTIKGHDNSAYRDALRKTR